MSGERKNQQRKKKESKQDGEKVKTLTLALDAEKIRSQEYLTQLKYVQADFQNLQKRLDRQMEEVKKISNERLIIELLNIIDELEFAMEATRSVKSPEAIAQGVEMTLKKMKKMLENEDVSHIECLGKPFDPSKHNAVAIIQKDGVEESKIIEEVRKGYTMKGKVIRPSTVKISLKKEPVSLERENK